MRYILLLFSVFLFSCGNTIYIVRHAEKATAEPNMSSDVPLTEKGKERAEALKEVLKTKKIASVFSTNTIRTKTTAKPAADYFGLSIETYNPKPDSAFIRLLKLKSGNTLVVGHSNTVDDIANLLCGSTVVAADLKDNQYDNLFVVKRKGKGFVFKAEKYGEPSK